MENSSAWIEPFITGVSTFGTIVFAASGAFAAGRHKMDPIGFILLGSVTAMGGGTIRDLLLDRPIAWVESPHELTLSVVVSLVTYFFIPSRRGQTKLMTWSDALGLSAFAVTGAQIGLVDTKSWGIAVAMGMVSATGGGIIRDLLTGHQPLILRGELYASTALLGAAIFVGLSSGGVTTPLAMLAGFLATLGLRASAIVFRLQLGEPGQLLRVAERDGEN